MVYSSSLEKLRNTTTELFGFDSDTRLIKLQRSLTICGGCDWRNRAWKNPRL